MQNKKLLEMRVTYWQMLKIFAKIFRRKATTVLLKFVRLNYRDFKWSAF